MGRSDTHMGICMHVPVYVCMWHTRANGNNPTQAHCEHVQLHMLAPCSTTSPTNSPSNSAHRISKLLATTPGGGDGGRDPGGHEDGSVARPSGMWSSAHDLSKLLNATPDVSPVHQPYTTQTHKPTTHMRFPSDAAAASAEANRNSQMVAEMTTNSHLRFAREIDTHEGAGVAADGGIGSAGESEDGGGDDSWFVDCSIMDLGDVYVQDPDKRMTAVPATAASGCCL